MPVIGRCRLCLTEDVELQRSHGIPAAVYRALRDDSDGENPNPLLLQTWGLVQTSRQPTAHLLCQACEQRFSVAERWVMNHGLQRDDTFPLGHMLADRATVLLRGQSFVAYEASSCAEVNFHLLTNFALSIFWRYAVHSWANAEGDRIILGPYLEVIRAALLGLAPFPENAVLSVALRPVGPLVRLVRVPQTVKVNGVRSHTFLMLGYVFTLFCGWTISESVRKFCIANSPLHPIIVSSKLEDTLQRSAISSLDRAEFAQAQRELKKQR